MVHASLSGLGWVIGGSEAVVLALLDAVEQPGTNLRPDELGGQSLRARGLTVAPAPRLRGAPAGIRSRAVRARALRRTARRAHPHVAGCPPQRQPRRQRGGGRIARRRADRPSRPRRCVRSRHAVCTARRVARPGAAAQRTAAHDQPAPPREAVAAVPAKRRVRYRAAADRRPAALGPLRAHRRAPRPPYTRCVPAAHEPVAVIAEAALAAGVGWIGLIGPADCHLFDAASLTRSPASGSTSASDDRPARRRPRR